MSRAKIIAISFCALCVVVLGIGIITWYFVNKIYCYDTDNSDNGLVKQKLQIQTTDCILPPHPLAGWWSILYNAGKYEPKMTVPKATILKIHCKKSYKLDGCKIVVCLDGTWTPQIGTCLKTCPSLHSESVLKITCTYKNTETENCTEAFDGTEAQFSCGYFYRDIRRNRRKIYCADGKWSENMTECVPVCGQATIKPTLIANGGYVEKGDFPWQVAVYQESDTGSKNLICGGSLLSEKIVLTAAHCVSNDYGEVNDKTLYSVAVGKSYLQFNDSRDSGAQFTTLYEIIVQDYYRAHLGNYANDIAILITNTSINFSTRVQPICVDWQEVYRDEIKNPKKFGHVSGWGLTEVDGKQSEVLKNLTVPIIGKNQCEKELPEDFVEFYTNDKICAGYLNKGKSVCAGDSGGGLVMKIGIQKYIVGVVSLAPKLEETNECNVNQYALYTNVYPYIEEFILPRVIATKPRAYFDDFDDSDDCDKNREKCTPTGDCDPLKGPISWVYINDAFTKSVKLKISCLDGYKLVGNDVTSCLNGKWTPEIGKCLKTCSSISNRSTMTVTCSYNQKQENCSGAIDGTVVKYKCAEYYESKFIESLPIVCLNGTWSRSLPECVPICGHKAKLTLWEKQGPYPWHLAIYDVKERSFICSGTLLSEKFVISAAICFTNSKGDLRSIQNLKVAAGKFHQRFGSEGDFFGTQSMKF